MVDLKDVRVLRRVALSGGLSAPLVRTSADAEKHADEQVVRLSGGTCFLCSRAVKRYFTYAESCKGGKWPLISHQVGGCVILHKDKKP